MGKADKRARKRENQAKARVARESAAKRAKQRKQVTYGAGGLVVIIVVVALASFFGSSDKPKAKATTTTTPPATASTIPPTTTTTKLPAGCVGTVPAKIGNGKQYKAAPAMTINVAKKYTATFQTTCGSFTAELATKDSPKGVNNFVFLAKAGFYNGLQWHRTVKNFVIQGGDPQATGSGGPGYSTGTEWPKQDFKTGDLAWAKSNGEAPGTAGSQFFVTTGSPASLNGTKKGTTYDYGYFGHVTSGLDVAQKLESLAPGSGDGAPTHPLYILKVTISES